MVRLRMLLLVAGAGLLGCSAARPLDICSTRGGTYSNVAVQFEWKTDALHYTEYVLPQCPRVMVAVYDGRLSNSDRRRMAVLADANVDRSADLSVATVSFVGTFSYDEKTGLRRFFPTRILELR